MASWARQSGVAFSGNTPGHGSAALCWPTAWDSIRGEVASRPRRFVWCPAALRPCSALSGSCGEPGGLLGPAGALRGTWARPHHGTGVEEGKGRCLLLSRRFHEERPSRRGRRLSGLGVGVRVWDAAAHLRAQVTLTAVPLLRPREAPATALSTRGGAWPGSCADWTRRRPHVTRIGWLVPALVGRLKYGRGA